MRSHSSCPVIEYANSFRVATNSRVGSGPRASSRFSLPFIQRFHHLSYSAGFGPHILVDR